MTATRKIVIDLDISGPEEAALNAFQYYIEHIFTAEYSFMVMGTHPITITAVEVVNEGPVEYDPNEI